MGACFEGRRQGQRGGGGGARDRDRDGGDRSSRYQYWLKPHRVDTSFTHTWSVNSYQLIFMNNSQVEVD